MLTSPRSRLLVLLSTAALWADPAPRAAAPRKGCPACHAGIEPIRGPATGMMKEILLRGREMGDPEGCVVCHGGDPAAEDEAAAHAGEAFYPDPGSPWINRNTCGLCHRELVSVQWNSLMMTEAGKIQGTAWAFGSLEGYEHGWGNYDAQSPASPGRRLGTKAYRAYMARLEAREPGAFPARMTRVPDAPRELGQIGEHPERAAFTYLRTECQRCHLAVRGREKRGDYRGMGCSACHIPYGNEGRYEGDDPTIPRDEPGHLLVHSIQATGGARAAIHGKAYSGIPVETCTTCHDRGKRIGVSFQGLMEGAYASPFTEGGGGQIALHTKHYIAMQEDIHYRKGMVCQDCHTSGDVHGDGFLAGTNLAQVEIECADCHGTPAAFPWELPLGFGDEFGVASASGPARGTAAALAPYLTAGNPHPPEDGYLLTARGNPLPEVVRRGDLVVVHTAGGKDLELEPLKRKREQDTLDTEPRVAMAGVSRHLERMECYACHATWAPQCYGCHVKVDYSGGARSFDWVAAGHRHGEPGHAADRGERGYDTTLPGKVEEQRSSMRWEDPPLGVGGEGRVSPVMPGCQVSVTVIGPRGEAVLANHIFRTAPGTEGAGPEGQLGIDMSPAQPHTMGHARPCASCHLSEKALGYGIGGGRLNRPWNEPTTVDLATADGRILPDGARTQIEPIEGLEADWSRFVTEDGRQLQTVGHHFSLSRPLDSEERAHIDRRGLCLACHREIPDGSLAVSLLHHVASYAGMLPRTAEAHGALVHKTLLVAGWAQVLLAPGAVLAILLAGGIYLARRRRRKARAGGPVPGGTAEDPED